MRAISHLFFYAFWLLVAGSTIEHTRFSNHNNPSRILLLRKFHHRRTNRLRAGQNEAVLLLDLDAVVVR
jgi:hypothetical protein